MLGTKLRVLCMLSILRTELQPRQPWLQWNHLCCYQSPQNVALSPFKSPREEPSPRLLPRLSDPMPISDPLGSGQWKRSIASLPHLLRLTSSCGLLWGMAPPKKEMRCCDGKPQRRLNVQMTQMTSVSPRGKTNPSPWPRTSLIFMS